MIRTIIALNDATLSDSIADVLTHRGITVRYRCQSGAEVIRAVREMDGGVVICTAKLRDMTAVELADCLDGQASLLVLAKSGQLALCDRDDLFTMTVPVRPAELIGAVTMLLQMDAMRAARTIPKRSDDDQKDIEAAKALLMTRHGMTEDQAHRYLQQHSMRIGLRMGLVARAFLENGDQL